MNNSEVFVIDFLNSVANKKILLEGLDNVLYRSEELFMFLEGIKEDLLKGLELMVMHRSRFRICQLKYIDYRLDLHLKRLLWVGLNVKLFIFIMLILTDMILYL